MNRIIVNKNEKFKSVFVSINFLLPQIEEDMSKNALISIILKKGKSEKELIKSLANLYSAKLDTSVEKIGDYYNLQIVLEILNENYIAKDFEKAVEFLIDTIESPLTDENIFAESIVEREKLNLKKKIEEEKDDKRAYAIKRAEEVMFEGSSYGYPTLGQIKDVDKISSKNILSYYKNMLSVSIPIIVVTGNSDKLDKIANDLYKRLEKISAIKENNIDRVRTIFDIKGELVEVLEEEKLNQSVIVIGLTVCDFKKEDLYKVILFDKILGGTPSSKLFQNVREKNSLAYFAKSMYNRQKNVIYMYAGIAPEKYNKAKEIMLNQINEIKENLSTEEYAAARDYLISNYKNFEDSKFESGRILFSNQIYFGKIVTPQEMIDEIRKVSIEDIRNLANKIKPIKLFLLGGKIDE